MKNLLILFYLCKCYSALKELSKDIQLNHIVRYQNLDIYGQMPKSTILNGVILVKHLAKFPVSHHEFFVHIMT